MALKPDLREFPGISHLAFQHPLDAQARVALEKVPLLPKITKALSGNVTERFIRVSQISSSVRITARQYPSLYQQYVRMAQVLDLPKLPDLYIRTTPVINASAMGVENYFIEVTSGLVDIMTEDELLAVIAHELGHVKCEHMLYVTMAHLLREFGANIIEQIVPGVGYFASVGIQLAILEWYRKAEFSCDRAGLLAVQEPGTMCSALSKLAGYSKNLEGELSIEEVKEQAAAYQEIGADSNVDKIVKAFVLLSETHPYPVVRVAEISLWSESSEYAQILTGNYQKLSPTGATPGGAIPSLSTPTGLVCANPKCKAIWPAGTSFCGKCGGSLKTAQPICGKCLNFISPSWSVCANCGNRLVP